MMNSYFDHSSGFYNSSHHHSHHHATVADPHQTPYRPFAHSLSLVPAPQPTYQPASRANSSSTASDSSGSYSEAASCKLYTEAVSSHALPPAQPVPPPVFKGEAVKDQQNGFKAPEQLPSAWNARPTTAGGFDVNSRSDAWTACCQNPSSAPFVDPYSGLRPFDGSDYHHHHHHRYTSSGGSSNGKRLRDPRAPCFAEREELLPFYDFSWRKGGRGGSRLRKTRGLFCVRGKKEEEGGRGTRGEGRGTQEEEVTSGRRAIVTQTDL